MSPQRVIVIGGGPGGYVAAIRASQLGAKVVLIEKDEMGGTCLRRGCIPTKSLLHDAKFFRTLKQSSVFQPLFYEGFSPLESMMERKERVIKELAKGVEMLLESQQVTVIYGCANLSGPKQVAILYGDKKRKEMIEGDVIILAPGSKTKTLPAIPLDGEKIITSDEALKLKEVPSEIVIIGGGYIGVEFATIFNALGSKVTIVEVLDDILLNMEGELVRHLKRALERDGIKILTKSVVDQLNLEGDRYKLMVKTPQGMEGIFAEKLLISVGRDPNLGLDFSRAGIKISTRGINVNQRLETTAPHIYAIGDATGGTMLAHVAMEEGVIAAENAMGMSRNVDENLIPLCIFTYPEIASVGLTEKEARGRGEIKIGRFPFRSNSTAVISEEIDGLIKVIVRRDGDEILGVHIIGHDASTLISIASSIMRHGVKATEFARFIQAHPTAPEALKEAFLDVDGLAIHLPKPLRPKE